MSIPEYHVTRIILEEHMNRQFDEDPREDRRRRYDRERPRITTTVRALLSATVYRLARAIDPAPRTTTPATTLRHTP